MTKSITMQLKIDNAKCRGCLSCQLACSFTRHGAFNPAKSCIAIQRSAPEEDTFPIIDYDCCNLCGGDPACVEACPYGTISFEPAGVD
jgi:carbon-monoxide dehydrogenase iron sulfur subunit